MPRPAARRRFDQTWLINFLIRNSMVIVLLLVMAYFSYRSVRFATPDNALHHSGGCRPVRPGRAGPDVRHPHRWHRSVRGQRDRGAAR